MLWTAYISYAFIHYGAAVNAEIDALGGIHDKSEN
jgi:hypothetical protein